MTINYLTEHDFYDGIQEMVKRGLTFEANGSNYTIKLTGGY